MKKLFMFIEDDFREVELERVKTLTDGQLVESLQGTLIGVQAMNELSSKVELIDLGDDNYLRRAENPIKKQFLESINEISKELRLRLGDERLESIIANTLILIKEDETRP